MIGLGASLILKIEMIFYLTNSLVVPSTDSSYQDIRKAVRNLAISSCEGKHYVLGDLNALEHFRRLFRPSNDDVSMLFDLLIQTYATQTIPNDVFVYVEVVNSDNPMKRRQGDCDVIEIDYKDFLDSCAVQATVLIGEDIDYDCWFYRFILDWYIALISLNIKCRFIDRHGGGDKMESVLEACCSQKETSLCFVDSDKRFPGQPVGSHSTSQKCLNARRGNRNAVVLLDVHEIENLLPLNYINQLKFENEFRNRKKMFDKLTNCTQKDYVLHYFDFKEGLKKYKEYKDYDGFIRFAKTVCEINPEVMEGLSFDDYYARKNDDELLYPGLMKRVLKHTIDYIKGVSESLPAPELLSFQDGEWKRIGRIMLSYGIARPEESVSN